MEKKINYFKLGIICSLIVTGIILVSDLIDELIIDEDSVIGFAFCFITPIVLSALHILYIVFKKPTISDLKKWFLGFIPLTVFLGTVICILLANEVFIIPQKSRGFFFDLNGAEYFIYFVFSVFGYLIIIGLFYLVKLILKFINSKKQN